MYVPKYPKTQSLWKRDMRMFCDCADLNFPGIVNKCPNCGGKPSKVEGFGLIVPGQYTWPEFQAVENWHVTEKIHGQNIRIVCNVQHFDNAPSEYEVVFYGRRGKEGSVNKYLLPRLKKYFTADLFKSAFNLEFDDEKENYQQQVILYGEGYGDKIQSWHYGLEEEQSFILFDVVVGGIWLTQETVTELAQELGIERVPILYSSETKYKAIDLCVRGFESRLCPGHPAEGVVARSEPLMLHRTRRTPIMWKLKCKDYDALRQFKTTGVVQPDKYKGF